MTEKYKDLTNAQRAYRGKKTLEFYRKKYDKQEDDRTVAIDLMTDLFHHFDTIDMEHFYDTAEDHYFAELKEEEEAAQ